MLFLVNVTQLLNCHSLEHIADVFMALSYGTYLTRLLMLFVLFGARDSGAFGTLYCALLPLLCGLLPLMDELTRRCAAFINDCLDSDCDVVDFVTRHRVYFRRMLSPIGRNSLCTTTFDMWFTAPDG